MRTSILIVLVLVAVAGGCFTYDCIHCRKHIDLAKNMVVNHSGQSRKVAEGFSALAQKEGHIEWSQAEVANSGNKHISMVRAVVYGKDRSEKPHQATIDFRIVDDGKSSEFDYMFIDGRPMDSAECSKLIVAGTFDI